MVKSSGLAAAAALLLASSPLASGMYSQSSPVLQVTARSYDNLIAQSNHTSIVEFYAPWCGHCKNLKPAYEKAAKSLSGLAKVAAIDCDDGSNKPFCGSMGVQGFPTLKIVRPGKKEGHPIVEDYNGARTAKAIVDAVIDKIPNHVKRLKDNDYLPWIGQDDEPRAILVTEKGTVSPLFKSVAIDFLGSISFAQIRDKEAKAVETLGIEKIPTLLLLPGLDKEAVKYEGEMKRDAIVAFLSQVAPPNQPKTSDTKKAKASKADQKKAASSKAGDSADSAVPKEAKAQPPKAPEVAPPIKSLPNENALLRQCLNDKAGTCILVLLPQEETASASAQQAIDSLSQIHFKHGKGNKGLFPFYQVPASLPAADGLRKQLNIDTPTVEIISVNGKRAWWRRYPSDNFQMQEIEAWVDAIRMGDLPKQDLPDDLIADASTLPPEPVEQEDDAPPDIKAMRDAFKASMPEGMDIELEEVSDEDYERIMKGNAQAANGGHDEL